MKYTYLINENGIKFVFNLAGTSKNEVKVRKSKDRLLVEVNSKNKHNPWNENGNFYVDVSDYALYPNKYDFSKMKASMSDGLLEVLVPNSKEELEEVSWVEKV